MAKARKEREEREKRERFEEELRAIEERIANSLNEIPIFGQMNEIRTGREDLERYGSDDKSDDCPVFQEINSIRSQKW